MVEPCSKTEASLETGENSSDLLFVVMLAGEERFEGWGKEEEVALSVIYFLSDLGSLSVCYRWLGVVVALDGDTR